MSAYMDSYMRKKVGTAFSSQIESFFLTNKQDEIRNPFDEAK